MNESLESVKDNLNCLDKTDRFGNHINMAIYGGLEKGVKRILEIMYRPCIPRQLDFYT